MKIKFNVDHEIYLAGEEVDTDDGLVTEDQAKAYVAAGVAVQLAPKPKDADHPGQGKGSDEKAQREADRAADKAARDAEKAARKP